jgi:hypothetical protein
MDAESSLLVNDGRARGRSDNKASLLLGLVVIAIAICIAAMQVFIIVNVKRNQDLVRGNILSKGNDCFRKGAWWRFFWTGRRLRKNLHALFQRPCSL